MSSSYYAFLIYISCDAVNAVAHKLRILNYIEKKRKIKERANYSKFLQIVEAEVVLNIYIYIYIHRIFPEVLF